MKETHTRTWVSIIAYSVTCILFLGLLYLVAETFFPKTSPELVPRDDVLSAKLMSVSRWRGSDQNAQMKAYSNSLKKRIMLVLDRDLKIGRSKIVYRGLEENDQFRMDVMILDLDPDIFYRYTIPINDAKEGFRLVGQNFRLISARKSTIQLWHWNNGRSPH